jgi:hypothetical protein
MNRLCDKSSRSNIVGSRPNPDGSRPVRLFRTIVSVRSRWHLRIESGSEPLSALEERLRTLKASGAFPSGMSTSVAARRMRRVARWQSAMAFMVVEASGSKPLFL